MESTGKGNPECYAHALEDCRGRVNREHYVSECILELVDGRAGEVSKSVLVRGLNFQQRGVVESKGVASLIAKILCKGHNSFLGQRFDPAGLALFKAMDAMNDDAAFPLGSKQSIRVDGDNLERWMLKTFIGGVFSGNFAVAEGETMKGVYPPRDWLEILFKGGDFSEDLGLYWLAGTPGSVFTADREILQMEPIIGQGTRLICGMRVRFFGFNFAISMGRILPGGSGPFENFTYRPSGIRLEGTNARINLGWKSGPATDEIVVARQ